MRYLIICLIVLLTVSLASAQDVPTCATADDVLFLRDDWANARISLVSWRSGETLATLESDLAFSSYQFVDWSADCHYALAGVDGQTVAWDVQAGVRMGTLDAAPTPRVRTYWSPDGNRLVLQTQSGGYLWPMGADPVLLESAVDGYGRSFFSTEWDTQHNELLAVQVGTPNGVTAYDANGQQVGFFHIGDRRGFVEYRRIENNQTIFVYSGNEERLDNSTPFGLALWSRDDSRQMQLSLISDNDASPVRYDMAEFSPFGEDQYDLIGGLTDGFFVANYYSLGASFLGVWSMKTTDGTIGSIVVHNEPEYFSSNTGNYVRIANGFLDIADWTWSGTTLSVSRVSIDSQDIIHQSSRFQLQQCEKYASQASEFSDLYEWACSMPGPLVLPKSYSFPNRVYQNGENNALIWTRQ